MDENELLFISNLRTAIVWQAVDDLSKVYKARKKCKKNVYIGGYISDTQKTYEELRAFFTQGGMTRCVILTAKR